MALPQQRRELIGNVMAISNALNAAAAPAIADQVRDPNRQNYYVLTEPDRRFLEDRGWR